MRYKRLLWAMLALLAITAAAGVAWAVNAPAPMPEAMAALTSIEGVSVATSGNWLVFSPAGAAGAPTSGLIFYPGGRVDPRSYAPLAQAIALQGHRVVIVPMPLNLAVLGSERASAVIAAFPETTTWTIGGHSLGGAMAARYAVRNPGSVAGLLLLAAYPAASDSLAGSGIPVVSVYGTRDGLATPAKVEASRPLLPPDTAWLAIEGGNHAQFGWYGDQAGDNPATISREAQHEQVVAAVLLLLGKR